MSLKVFLAVALTVTACQSGVQSPISHRFDNGRWYQDDVFTNDTVYIVDGVLRFASDKELPVGESTEIIDLEGGFAIPPFCEAHNHNLGSGFDGVEETIDAYLQDGVYYVMMAGSFPIYRKAAREKLNKPDSIDVAFANNGLTGSGGHPRALRESLMERFDLYPEFSKETLADHGYFEADTLAALHEKWKLILTDRPDFIKTMLYFSEEFEERKNNPDYYGRRGLNPDLLHELIPLAHDEGLRVMAHVESDYDMMVALQAGADIIGHLVSHDSTMKISNATVALAKEKGVSVVTTASLARRFAKREPDRYAATLKAQADNLQRLHDAGVNLALGSDNTRDTSRGEAEHLAGLGIFDNASLLNMWTKNCTKTVFPERAIGKLDDGYDASFLILGGDPLADFANTRKINMRVKEGVILN